MTEQEQDQVYRLNGVREQVHGNTRAQLELRAAVSQILRTHLINIDDDVLRDLTFALPQELGRSLRPTPPPPIGSPESSPRTEKPASNPSDKGGKKSGK